MDSHTLPRTTSKTSVPRWQHEAACRGLSTELFFPARGEPLAPPQTVCAGCKVRAECFEHAVEARERFGIWGGTSERERRRIRIDRARRRPGDVGTVAS